MRACVCVGGGERGRRRYSYAFPTKSFISVNQQSHNLVMAQIDPTAKSEYVYMCMYVCMYAFQAHRMFRHCKILKIHTPELACLQNCPPGGSTRGHQGGKLMNLSCWWIFLSGYLSRGEADLLLRLSFGVCHLFIIRRYFISSKTELRLKCGNWKCENMQVRPFGPSRMKWSQSAASSSQSKKIIAI